MEPVQSHSTYISIGPMAAGYANTRLSLIIPDCFNVKLPDLSLSCSTSWTIDKKCVKSRRNEDNSSVAVLFDLETDWDFMYNKMTFEELNGDYSQERMDAVAKALEEVLTSALPQGCITVGVYEAAKALNVDPDNVVLCILATDDEDVKDVALQIHFTLIQAFCCENDINILRVNNTRRLAEILGGGGGGGKQNGGEPLDLHCVLVTSPHSTSWKDPALSKLNRFCRESRCMDQWVPIINLPER